VRFGKVTKQEHRKGADEVSKVTIRIPFLRERRRSASQPVRRSAAVSEVHSTKRSQTMGKPVVSIVVSEDVQLKDLHSVISGVIASGPFGKDGCLTCGLGGFDLHISAVADPAAFRHLDELSSLPGVVGVTPQPGSW
jgi:hypothetical protein